MRRFESTLVGGVIAALVASAAFADSAEDMRGKNMYLRCQTCHTVNKDGAHLTGPSLYGLFGSKAGAKDSYKYSKALASSDFVWTEETLSAWVENPSALIPETTMAFPGIKNADDRKALIKYLRQVTSPK